MKRRDRKGARTQGKRKERACADARTGARGSPLRQEVSPSSSESSAPLSTGPHAHPTLRVPPAPCAGGEGGWIHACLEEDRVPAGMLDVRRGPRRGVYGGGDGPRR